ncbi:integrin alpha-PS2-like [Schistocerca piceifrons]|uniref:integrin alpha-PS2-like n=1 Tax=Schistocerca piceifrons TaxID=274613 RepID=UPI001F5FC8FF|nr:integrin alpha-PS2-like [Schistocerca piceifrons]
MCSSSNNCVVSQCRLRVPNSLRLLSVLTCLLGFVGYSATFNVDTEHMVRFRGSRGSMFGFTVAEHQDIQGNAVLVGAPADDTSRYQPGVVRGGAVYRCDVRADDYCQQMPFDRNGNQRNYSGYDVENKSYQWFGATLQTSGNGNVVACAPRYVNLPWTSVGPSVDPVGTCYVASDNFRRITEYAPCRGGATGHHQLGSCQAGFSACLSKEGDRLFMGAPGSWYWQGQVYSQSLHDKPDISKTTEGPVILDNSYLGYSMAAGDFTGDGSSGTAVGMPRGGRLFGKVILYTETLDVVDEFTGEQLGAYFGYAICIADMNGDNTDDIVIGAPLYTLPNNEGKYETGRIYVIYQEAGMNRFTKNHWRDGVNSKSRFGLSLASIGDINKDGYGDIAVGAPYDGPRGGGAVYIYHGSNAGIMKETSQVIYGENIYNGITTFGFSVTGGVDLDNNQYPDIAVGAYDADVALFFKSRPVIVMDARVTLGPESKVISLEENNCTLRDGTMTTCTTVTMCFKYSGIGVDPQHEFEVQLVLDAKKPKSPRLFFHRNEGINSKNFTLTLSRNSEYCRSHSVYIRPGIRDKLSPLEAVIKYDTKYSRERVQRSLTPVLDQRKPLSEHDAINIQKNCGADNICIPDLVLETDPAVTRYFLGSGEKLEIEVKVINMGEDSFETMYNLKIPPGLHYTKIERLDDNEQEIPVLCSAPSTQNNNTLKCDIGNPLPRNKQLHYKVVLEPFYKENLKPQYEFVTEINSTNPENASSLEDNVKRFSVPISIKTDISVMGASNPQELYYNATAYRAVNITRESEIGPQVTHTYTIVNQGPSDIVEAEVYVLWPMYTLAGDPFFYVLEQPDVSGPIVCDKLVDANPFTLKIEQRGKGLEGSIYSTQQGNIGAGGSSVSKTTSEVTVGGRSTITETHRVTSSNTTYHQIAGADTTLVEHKAEGGIFSDDKLSTGQSSSTVSEGGDLTYKQQFEKGHGGGEGYNITYYYGPDNETSTGRRIYTYRNYTVTWDESGKPTRHYSNYSFSTSEDSERAFSLVETGAMGAGINKSVESYESSQVHHRTSPNTSQFSSTAHVVTDHGIVQPVAKEGGIRFVPAPGFGGDETSDTLHVEEHLFPGSVTSDGQLKHYWISGEPNTVSQSGTHRTLNDISRGTASQHHSSGSAQSAHSHLASSTEDIGSGVRKYSSQQWSHSQSYPSATEERHYESVDGETEYEYEEEDEYYEETDSMNADNSRHSANLQQSKGKTDKFKLYDRFRRDVATDNDFQQLIQCNSTKCIRLRCVVKKFIKDQEINIQIRSRAWVQTLKKVASNKPLRVSSLLAMQVTQLPYIGKPYYPVIRSEEVFTDAISTDVPVKPDIVPLWVVVLSACAGVLILLLLVLLLWKCGFFKRNRPSDAAEKEPLNRNGSY